MNEIVKNSTQYFRAVDPLLHAGGDDWMAMVHSPHDIYVGAAFTVAGARKLRDWLDKAIPEKPTVWFDAGYLGNGHCPFMRSTDGASCCGVYGHGDDHWDNCGATLP